MRKKKDDLRECRLSLIVSRIVTRGSLTSIFRPNMVALTKTVFHTVAPKTSHIHVHTENNEQCDETRGDLTQSHFLQLGLDRCGLLLILHNR